MSKATEKLKQSFGRMTRVFRGPIERLTAEWDRMAPRERQLAALLGLAGVVLVLSVTGYLFFSGLAEVRDRNESIRDALSAIAKNRNEYLAAKAQMRAQEIRIGSTPPQLATDLEAAARGVGIQIAETNEQSPTPIGKLYLEHNVDATLRQIELRQLTKFLNTLETSHRLIYITRLDIRRRFAEKDKLDVKVTATAIERLKQDIKPRRPGGRGRPGGPDDA